MKKVLILFGSSNWKKSRPFENKDYQYSYEYFYNLCKKNGIQMYRASYEWYDYEKNIFKHAWIYAGPGADWKKVANIRPDLIYDKTKARLEVYYKKELIGRHYPFINDLQFTQIIDDKMLTGLIFSPWSKQSYLVDNLSDMKRLLPQIKTSKFVLKPLMESGGKDVYILDKKDSLKQIDFSRRYILQDFIDSSRGVPGVSRSLHDLRLVMINGKLIYAYIREPKPGSFLANLAQGGSLHIVPEKKLPKNILPIVASVDKALSPFAPRVYSIDFMFDRKGRPWIVELNSMPGLFFSPNEKSSMIKMYQELLKIFKAKLKNGHIANQ